jgi:hypothetical protein
MKYVLDFIIFICAIILVFIDIHSGSNMPTPILNISK